MTTNNDWIIPKTWSESYINIIKQALESEIHFKLFRQNQSYSTIISSYIPQKEAEILFNIIQENQEIINKINTIKLMDQIGSPGLQKPWMTCARNFKYMYASLLIKKFFGPNIHKIVEIGVGYGGLCFTINQYFNITGYKLVDIDCVVKLAKLFLSKLPSLNNNILIEDYFNPKPPYDLCISECGISELNEKSILDYYNKYLKNSKYLFIRTNFEDQHRQYKINDFIDLIKKDFIVKRTYELKELNNSKSLILGYKI